MSRTFWLAVGAVGGIVAYRKSAQAAARARELGALGTAQAAAHATSRLAGRTAHGLGRLNDIKAKREGRLVIGSAEEVDAVQPVATQTGGSRTAPRRPPAGSAARAGNGRAPEGTARDGA